MPTKTHTHVYIHTHTHTYTPRQSGDKVLCTSFNITHACARLHTHTLSQSSDTAVMDIIFNHIILHTRAYTRTRPFNLAIQLLRAGDKNERLATTSIYLLEGTREIIRILKLFSSRIPMFIYLWNVWTKLIV